MKSDTRHSMALVAFMAWIGLDGNSRGGGLQARYINLTPLTQTLSRAR